jgi:hypothetical protein
MSVGVFVLGMHRSGTSTATRLINLFGVPMCAEEDLKPTTPDNPRGYWESESLTNFNDRILAAVGCDWTCPPILGPGWEADPALDPLYDQAAGLFRRLHPTDQWVWKDPRNCLTFAFWARCLDVRSVVLLVHRNPLEVAASLGVRDGMEKLDSLALWERYLRLALASASRLPTLVTDYSDLLSDPVEWCKQAREFLESAGVATSSLDQEEALGFVDAGLRHAQFGAEELVADPAVSEPQRELFLAVQELRGVHPDLSPPILPSETRETEVRLGARRVVYALARDQSERRLELDRFMRKLGERCDVLEDKIRELRARCAALEQGARALGKDSTAS